MRHPELDSGSLVKNKLQKGKNLIVNPLLPSKVESL